MQTITVNGRRDGFNLMRAVGATRGAVADVDPLIKAQLDTLNQLLEKRVFEHSHLPAGTNGNTPRNGGTQGEKKKAGEDAVNLDDQRNRLESLVRLPLTPERAPGKNWAEHSLAAVFNSAVEHAGRFSVSEMIDGTPGLATLKYAFQDEFQSNLNTIGNPARAVLENYPAISDYLVAYAYYEMNLDDASAVKNFILGNPLGARNIAEYAIIGAARAFVSLKQINVPEYEKDDSHFVKSLRDAGLSLDEAAFIPGVTALLDNLVYDKKYTDLLGVKFEKTFGKLSPEVKRELIRFFKASPVEINEHNVLLFAPAMIQQATRSLQSADTVPEDRDQSDLDFDVKFLDDNRSQVNISKSAVKCAAQLYYAMILGEELEVFNVINYFTHKYLVRGSLTIEDGHLRENLQQYVFSNRFTDGRTNKLVDRTRPAERAMFYRQVFNYGAGPVSEDIIVNQEFPGLWKMLMLESAKYLQRAQISPNPDTYVSPQNVMQAAEDIQYNLSTHCTGMANVITPLIYAELDFVIRKILMHPEIINQVAGRSGATWWRVVEILYMGMKNERPKATVIYNKATKGHDIIRAIAEYDPAVFTQSQQLSEFIGKVEGFIITQSILQEALTHDLKKTNSGDAEADKGAAQAPAPAEEDSGSDNASSGNQWDF